jgi:hypothetical protein
MSGGFRCSFFESLLTISPVRFTRWGLRAANIYDGDIISWVPMDVSGVLERKKEHEEIEGS